MLFSKSSALTFKSKCSRFCPWIQFTAVSNCFMKNCTVVSVYSLFLQMYENRYGPWTLEISKKN